MKPENDKKELLVDLIEDAPAERAPGLDGVLAVIRDEKQARHNRRIGMVSVAAMILLTLVFLKQPAEVVEPIHAAVTRPAVAVEPGVSADEQDEPVEEKSSPLTVDRVDDDELLALIDDQAVALVKLPEGERALLWFQ